MLLLLVEDDFSGGWEKIRSWVSRTYLSFRVCCLNNVCVCSGTSVLSFVCDGLTKSSYLSRNFGSRRTREVSACPSPQRLCRSQGERIGGIGATYPQRNQGTSFLFSHFPTVNVLIRRLRSHSMNLSAYWENEIMEYFYHAMVLFDLLYFVTLEALC